MKSLSQSMVPGNINFFIKCLFIKHGYTKNSTPEQIKSIYKQICMSYHPDMLSDEFKDLSDIFSHINDVKVLLIKDFYENIGNRGFTLSPTVS